MSTYPSYSLGIGTVITVNPYTHVYRINDFLQTKEGELALTSITAVPLGSRGDSDSGVQFQTSYQPGDIVLYVRETGGESTIFRAFIIGSISADRDYEGGVDPAKGTTWDGANLNNTNFKLFDQIEQTAGAVRVDSNVGHAGIDMLPGAYEIVGKLLAFQFSDYYAAIRATCAEILVNGIDRRIVLQSMLRTDSTVNSISDIAILNRSTIDTHKWCGNVKSAWYDCLAEDNNSITPIEDQSPKYRIIEQSGDILYGQHKTLLDQSAQTPLYTEYLGLDGTKKILTASRLIVGKYPGVKSREYIGPRLEAEPHDDEEPTPEKPEDSLANLKDTSENWVAYTNLDFIENGGYPDKFLDPDEAEYPDFDPIEVDDDLRQDGKIQIFPGNSYIDYQEDGSIKISDAWGSYILLSHGNIELHARNNIFAVAGRDNLTFAGGNITTFAKQSIEQQAANGNFRAVAKKSLQLCSEELLSVEARNKLYITANTSEVASLNATIRCIDPTQPNDANLPGKFQIVAENGFIDFVGQQIRSHASYISLTSDKFDQAFVIGGSAPLLVGSLDIRGGLYSKNEEISLKVPMSVSEDTDTSRVFANDPDTDWINDRGNVCITNGKLVAARGLYTTGNVCGTLVCDTRMGRKKYVSTVNASSLHSQLTYVPLNNRISAKDITITQPPLVQDYQFSFDSEVTTQTIYRLVAPMPESTNGKTYEGYKSLSKDTTFIYPGINFWTVDGVADYTSENPYGDPEYYGFNQLPTAKTK